MSNADQRKAKRQYLTIAGGWSSEQLQQLAAVHAQFGHGGVIRALEGVLTPGALEYAAASLNKLGFAGAVEQTRGDLQRIAEANTWLTENKIPHDSSLLPDEQFKLLHQAAATNPAFTPVELARNIERMKDSAEAAAEAERVKRGDAKPTKTQRLLEQADFHRVAAKYGKSGAAFVKELQAIGELDDFAEIEKRVPGLFSDGAEAREALGKMAAHPAIERLTAELDEHDGETPVAKRADPEDGWGLSESWKKATPRAQREARPQTKGPESEPHVSDDDWGLNAAWDRAGGGPELASGTITGPDSEGA